jgi:hypothetical protein
LWKLPNAPAPGSASGAAQPLVAGRVSILSDLEIENALPFKASVNLTALIDFMTTGGHPLPNFEELAGVNKVKLCPLSRSDHDAFKTQN